MNFQSLAAELLNQSRSLVPSWLPGGKIQGHEYCCGSISGGPGDSFRVNLDKGAWAEFSGDLKGGDLISLYAAIKGLSNGDAYKELGGEVSDQPSMIHPKYGAPAAYWIYRDRASNPIQYVARYNTPDGKQFLPWRLSGNKWICKALPTPRPLYGLDLLAERLNAPVLICEGEKATDAARVMAPDFVCITWPNGAKAWSKADWTPIYGRKVALWPDADEPGTSAMQGIAALLAPYCDKQKILDVSDKPAGWDAADATLTPPEFTAWCKATIYVNIAIAKVPELGEEKPATKSQIEKCEELGLAGGAKPICNAANVVKFFERSEYQDHLWFDEFYQQHWTDYHGPARPWTDSDDNNIMLKLQSEYGLHRISDKQVLAAVTGYCDTRKRNAPMDWMNTLVWDGVERIGTFFIDCMGAQACALNYAASHNFWVGMVARTFKPACQLDEMFVLEGAQGTYKTSAFRIIGGPWHTETRMVDSDEFFYALQGKLLIEISELEGFRRADITRIKQVITQRTDRYRPKYGRRAQDFPRRCLLVGTTNETEWIHDQSGGRRFVPIKVGKIDLKLIAETRNQLFAEAVECLKNDASWWQYPQTEKEAAEELRRFVDDRERLLDEVLVGQEYWTIEDAARKTGLVGTVHKRDQMEIAQCLKRIGFTKKQRLINGNVHMVWSRNGIERVDKVMNEN